FTIVVADLGDQMIAHLEGIIESLAGEAHDLLELRQRSLGMIGHDRQVRRRNLRQVTPAQSAEQPQGPFKVWNSSPKAQVGGVQILARQACRLDLIELLQA